MLEKLGRGKKWCKLYLNLRILAIQGIRQILVEEVEKFEINYILKLTDFSFFVCLFGVSVMAIKKIQVFRRVFNGQVSSK